MVEIGVQVTPSEFGDDDEVDQYARPLTVKGNGSRSKAAEAAEAAAAAAAEAEEATETTAMLQSRPPPPPAYTQHTSSSPTRPLVGGFFEGTQHSVPGDPQDGEGAAAGNGGEDPKPLKAAAVIVGRDFSAISFDLAQRVGDRLDSSLTTNQSDAGFQVNLASDAGIAVAERSARGDTSSPVGTRNLYQTLPSAKEALSRKTLPAVVQNEKRAAAAAAAAAAKAAAAKASKPESNPVVKFDVAVQTENDIITDESPNYRALPPATLCKWELVGDDLALFDEVDAWVAEVTEHYRNRTIKKLGKVVRALTAKIDRTDENEHLSDKFRGKEDLMKVRAFFRWIAENIV